MAKERSIINASNITNYQAVNCNGSELGIVEGLITLHNQNASFILLSTHHKDLFGNLKYAVPCDLCDIDDETKTIWLNVDKNELEFLYKFTDLYEMNASILDDDLINYFNIDKVGSSRFGSQNMNY